MNINFGSLLQGIGLFLCVGAILLAVIVFVAVRAFRSRNTPTQTPGNMYPPPAGEPRPDLSQRGTERPTYDSPDVRTSGGFGGAPIPPTGQEYPSRNVRQDRNEPPAPGINSPEVPRRTRDRHDDEDIHSGGGFGGR
jgi:hypothetical protein